MAFRSRTVALIQLLASKNWSWNRHDFEHTLSSLGWRKSDTVRHRTTYIRETWPDADAYYDDHRPEYVEFVIDICEDVDRLGEMEYEDKVDEFYKLFTDCTQEISEVLGSPAFSDGAAADGFPEDQEAVWLSLWIIPSARLMLQQKHEDRELPLRLCVVLAP